MAAQSGKTRAPRASSRSTSSSLRPTRINWGDKLFHHPICIEGVTRDELWRAGLITRAECEDAATWRPILRGGIVGRIETRRDGVLVAHFRADYYFAHSKEHGKLLSSLLGDPALSLVRHEAR